MYQLSTEFSVPAERPFLPMVTPAALPAGTIPRPRPGEDFGPVGRFMIASLVAGIVWVGPLGILVFLSW